MATPSEPHARIPSTDSAIDFFHPSQTQIKYASPSTSADHSALASSVTSSISIAINDPGPSKPSPSVASESTALPLIGVTEEERAKGDGKDGASEVMAEKWVDEGRFMDGAELDAVEGMVLPHPFMTETPTLHFILHTPSTTSSSTQTYQDLLTSGPPSKDDENKFEWLLKDCEFEVIVQGVENGVLEGEVRVVGRLIFKSMQDAEQALAVHPTSGSITGKHTLHLSPFSNPNDFIPTSRSTPRTVHGIKSNKTLGRIFELVRPWGSVRSLRPCKIELVGKGKGRDMDGEDKVMGGEARDGWEVQFWRENEAKRWESDWNGQDYEGGVICINSLPEEEELPADLEMPTYASIQQSSTRSSSVDPSTSWAPRRPRLNPRAPEFKPTYRYTSLAAYTTVRPPLAHHQPQPALPLMPAMPSPSFIAMSPPGSPPGSYPMIRSTMPSPAVSGYSFPDRQQQGRRGRSPTTKGRRGSAASTSLSGHTVWPNSVGAASPPFRSLSAGGPSVASTQPTSNGYLNNPAGIELWNAGVRAPSHLIGSGAASQVGLRSRSFSDGALDDLKQLSHIGGVEPLSGFSLQGNLLKHCKRRGCSLALGYPFISWLDEPEMLTGDVDLDLDGSSGPGQHVQVAQVVNNRGDMVPGYVDLANLFISNIDPTVDSNELFNQFQPHGRVVSAVIMRDNHKKSRGYGFVSFQTPGEAANGMIQMQNFSLRNQRIRIRWHEPKNVRADRALSPTRQSQQGSETGRASLSPPRASPPRLQGPSLAQKQGSGSSMSRKFSEAYQSLKAYGKTNKVEYIEDPATQGEGKVAQPSSFSEIVAGAENTTGTEATSSQEEGMVPAEPIEELPTPTSVNELTALSAKHIWQVLKRDADGALNSTLKIGQPEVDVEKLTGLWLSTVAPKAIKARKMAVASKLEALLKPWGYKTKSSKVAALKLLDSEDPDAVMLLMNCYPGVLKEVVSKRVPKCKHIS